MQRCSIQLLLENVSGITCKEEIFVSVLSINFCFCLSVRPRKKDFLINFLFGFSFTQNFKICKGILWVDLRKWIQSDICTIFFLVYFYLYFYYFPVYITFIFVISLNHLNLLQDKKVNIVYFSVKTGYILYFNKS